MPAFQCAYFSPPPMKNLALIIFGALLGAAAVWFGFTRQLLVINGNVVAINRFTGDAVNLDIRPSPIQQKENENATKAAEEEQARAAKTAPQNALSQTPVEQALNNEQLKLLQSNVTWNQRGGPLYVEMHNPFPDLTLKRLEIHVQYAEGEGDQPPTDRDYSIYINPQIGCAPLADCRSQLDWNLSTKAQQGAKITITKAFFRKET